jgi:anti-anti-sigma factor
MSQPAGFHIETAATPGTLTIRVAGKIDHATCEHLLTAFERASRSGATQVTLDLAELQFIDSAGLRSVIDIERSAREHGLSLRIVSPPEHVRAVFRLIRLEDRLQFTAPRREAPPDAEYAVRMEMELPVSDRAPVHARAEVREAVRGKLSESE